MNARGQSTGFAASCWGFPYSREGLFGTRLTQPLVLELFIKYHGPIGLREAGKAKVMCFARSKSSRYPSRLIDEIFEALSQQSVSVSGTGAVELVIPMLALNIKTLKAQRVDVAQQVEKLLANYLLLEVLMSIPGVGIRCAAKKYSFASAMAPAFQLPPT